MQTLDSNIPPPASSLGGHHPLSDRVNHQVSTEDQVDGDHQPVLAILVLLPKLVFAVRSEERRVGKSVDLGGRRIIKKKKHKQKKKKNKQKKKKNK